MDVIIRKLVCSFQKHRNNFNNVLKILLCVHHLIGYANMQKHVFNLQESE